MKNKVVIVIGVLVVIFFSGLGIFLVTGGFKPSQVPERPVEKVTSSTTSESSSTSTSESSTEVSTEVAVDVPREELNASEAKLQSYIFNGDTIIDGGHLENLKGQLKSMTESFTGKTFADMNGLYNPADFKLQGTDSSMIMTAYLFFEFQKYDLDESYIKAWTSTPSHINQIIFRGKSDGLEDVYFLAYFDNTNSQFVLSMREGGTVNGTFG